MRYLFAAALFIFFHSSAAAQNYHAVVDAAGVHGSYTSVGAALEAAPSASKKPYLIFIRNGNYKEKLTVDKPNITLIGESREGTIITHDAYAAQKIPGSEETWGTFRSATLTVTAPDFRAENLTIENSFDFLANDALNADATNKIHGTQAVALAIDKNSDRAAFRRVKISGFQDTLYANSGRSYFTESRIEGNVDFIFGAGTALFENSDIISRVRGRKMTTSGYITAPSTNIHNAFGLIFIRCRLLKEQEVPDDSVPLGRPWHPTTTFPDGRYADPEAIGSSVFIQTYMDSHIAASGWASMRGTARDGTKSALFTPEDARFFEYQNYGPGAKITSTRRQLSERQAEKFVRKKILNGWTPIFHTF
ncbi:pectinesterase family protein [Microbulbifer thermotolerans]|uniref:pectinesterase family protein n=1 Tax=Microbulbifer thermotolerans TaxID=252514 RepID=UPI002672C28F|nr:pectinesterase family protein [Microbulbifer thermotolerans]WKT60976.1 pectinesterase family protein [Microbulbifer thermotolerans]